MCTRARVGCSDRSRETTGFSIRRTVSADDVRRAHWYENCMKSVTRFGPSVLDTTECPTRSPGIRSAWKRWEVPHASVPYPARCRHRDAAWSRHDGVDVHHSPGGDPGRDSP